MTKRTLFRAVLAWVAGVGVLASSAAAWADEMGQVTKLESLPSFTFTWGGYLHVAWRWIQQPTNLALAGNNNGFQLEQARLGLNAQYKDLLAVRISFEGASEDRINQSIPGGTITARLRDAYMTWAPLRVLRLSVGQMVVPWDLDGMRSDAELPFVSRAVPVEGVQASEGRIAHGMGLDRALGLALHSGDIALGTEQLSLRYQLMVANNNGQNQSLNSGNRPALFGRVELSFWGKDGIPEDKIGPIRARTDLDRFPIIGIGVAGQWVPHQTFEPPNVVNETDTGGAADVILAFYGVDLEGGILYVRTAHDTLSGLQDIERFGWWAHLRFTIPKIPIKITPGYRIASYAPQTHIWTTTPSDMTSAQQMSDQNLLYHTFGLSVRPTLKFPLHFDVNYTITNETGNQVLANDRFEIDAVAVF
jgi:hypothetical protein